MQKVHIEIMDLWESVIVMDVVNKSKCNVIVRLVPGSGKFQY